MADFIAAVLRTCEQLLQPHRLLSHETLSHSFLHSFLHSLTHPYTHPSHRSSQPCSTQKLASLEPSFALAPLQTMSPFFAFYSFVSFSLFLPRGSTRIKICVVPGAILQVCRQTYFTCLLTCYCCHCQTYPWLTHLVFCVIRLLVQCFFIPACWS